MSNKGSSNSDRLKSLHEKLKLITAETPTASSNESKKEEKAFDSKEDYRKETKEVLKDNRFKLNTTLRIFLGGWAALIVTSWLIFVGVILVWNTSTYKLSDDVLKYLLTTTTIEVLGIIVIAMSDLFNGKSEK